MRGRALGDMAEEQFSPLSRVGLSTCVRKVAVQYGIRSLRSLSVSMRLAGES